MLSIWPQLSQQLEEREALSLKRVRRTLESAQGAQVMVDGESLRCFCSNDYLGLANHPKVVEALQQASKKYGVGGGASHLVCGHNREHHLLEEEFATLTGRDRALLFSSGYMANLAVITTLLDKQDAIFADKLNHASLIDGGLLSGARFQRFLHNDMQSLQKQLRKSSARRKLICVDGVFSMDGDMAPLPELTKIAKQHDALLMVDDAHGFGVIGDKGLGCCDKFSSSQDDVPILMCTLGKSMGGFGAMVAGPELLIETLVQFARPYIYTTSIPPAVAAAARTSLQLLQQEGWRRENLQQLIAHFRVEAKNLNLPIMPSSTAIQPLLVGDEELSLQWQHKLQERGFWVSAIRPPTVPKGSARLRITLSAAHSLDDVNALLEALADIHRELPLYNSDDRQLPSTSEAGL